MPVQIVFNAPMTSQGFRGFAWAQTPAADKVMGLFGGFAIDGAFPQTHSHGGQSRPEFAVSNIYQIRDHNTRAFFFSAVALARGRDRRDLLFGKVAIERLGDRRLNIIQRSRSPA